uniref:HEPN_Apea domain-containing protein n=1 Tax=Parastrongyloides trichosuri TaxID=131310 RepID=A0A0N5A6N7_PARTI
MANKENQLQKFIFNSNSLAEIEYTLTTKTPFFDSIQNFRVNKVFTSTPNNLTLSLSNPKNVGRSIILCSFNQFNELPLNKFMDDVNLEPQINREQNTYISFFINDDTTRWSEEDKNFIAKKYASFAEFLLDIFPNGKHLKIFTSNISNDNKTFLFYILDKMKSEKIESLEIFHLYDILNYLKMYDVNESNIFKKTPNLKEISIDISTSHRYDEYEDFDKCLKTFLNFIGFNKFMKVNLRVEDKNDSIIIANKIIEYSRKLNLDICFIIKIEWNDCFLQEATDYVMKSFNFNSLMINLKKFKLSITNCRSINAFNDENYEVILFYDTFWKFFIGTFPSTVELLILKDINILSNLFYDNLAFQFPFLRKICFHNIHRISRHALYKFEYLRNVVIHGEICVDIPRWVEVVIFCYFNVNIKNSLNTLSDKNNRTTLSD